MKTNQINHDDKKLDSYSVLIVSKYFETPQDFINIICVNSKFKETTEKLRYNPIPITSKTLFPKIQTQYLYSKNDVKLKRIKRYEIWYNITYGRYLELRKSNIKCHHINYTERSLKNYGLQIPNTVHMLDINAFYGNTTQSMIIPNNITSIGDSCFQNCFNLTQIKLSTSLTKLNKHCFYGCYTLKSINLPPSIYFIEEGCFYNCVHLKEINIPKSVILIGSMAFLGCTSIKTIILPSLVKELNSMTFSNCFSLTKVILPSVLTSIGIKCFNECLRIKSIEIPSCIKRIGLNCFLDCTSLTNLKIESNVTKFSFNVSYNDMILYKQYGIDCSDIAITSNDVDTIQKKLNHSNEFIFPNNVVEIHAYAFSNNSIKSITIPTTVTSIGMDGFRNCSYLQSINIPSSVKSLGIRCFESCYSLTSIYFSSTLPSIGIDCFRGCNITNLPPHLSK